MIRLKSIWVACNNCTEPVDIRRPHASTTVNVERLTVFGIKVLSSEIVTRHHLACIEQAQIDAELGEDDTYEFASGLGLTSVVPKVDLTPLDHRNADFDDGGRGTFFHTFAEDLQRARALEPDVPTWGQHPGKDDGIR